MFKIKKKNKRRVRKKIAFKNYTLGGRISAGIALLSLFILIGAVAISYKNERNAGVRVGVMAFISLILSVAGFLFGLRSFYEKGSKFLKYTWIGTVCNMIIVLFYAGMMLVYAGGL